MIKPSKSHKNKSIKNFYIYDIYDNFLKKYAKYFRGIVYDLGCGEAPYKEFILKYASTYIGVDWMDSFHDIKADIIADLNKSLPIKSESADTIISFSVLEHLCEPQTMLNESYRILKPGGTIILQIPWQWWVHEAPHDYFRYTPFGLKYMVMKASFEEVFIEPQSGFFTTLILKMNYFSSRFIRGPKPLQWIIKGLLYPFWFLGQVIAPVLDKLDRNWNLETTGYYLVAKKNNYYSDYSIFLFIYNLKTESKT